MQEEITIYVIAAEDSADATVSQTLKGYEDASSYIKVTYVDPLVNPYFVSEYTTSSVSQNSIIVESAKRYKVISYNDMYETEIDYTTYSQNVTGYDAEGQLTSAISYCISDDMPKIYMIAGHNEYSLDSGFLTAIEKENIEYESISLMDYEAVPEDAECIIIHAPETDFSSDDADKVIAYLNQGGKAVITTEYVGGELPNFEKILIEFGMTIQEGYVVDANQGNYYQTPLYMLPNVEYADETSGLTDEYDYLLVPYAQGISVPDNGVEGMTYTKLLSGSDSSIVKTKVTNSSTLEKEEGDIEGPFTLGISIETSGAGQIIWFSAADFLNDMYNAYSSGANVDLAMNSLSSLIGEREAIAIRSKSLNYNYLTITDSTSSTLKTLMIGVFPLTYLGIGIFIIMRKRGRQNEAI